MTTRPDEVTARRRRLACLALVGAALIGVAFGLDGHSQAGQSTATDQAESQAAVAGRQAAARSDQTPSTTPSTTPPTTEPERPERITLAFGGDILPHTAVNEAAAHFGSSSGAAYDFAPMFAPLRPVLSRVDLPLCHLEVPLAPSPEQISSYPIFGAPRELPAGVASAGYRGCSTASNHSLDKGLAGIQTTLDTFDAVGLGHAGTARTPQEAATPRIYDVEGVAVAHLSYSYSFNGIPLPADAPWAANLIDPDRILSEAHAARAAGADLVVVSMHWGSEGLPSPDGQQQDLAPVLAASPDIDLVVGHHAHVVQPIQRMGDTFVVFGLGNQVSNQGDATQRDGLVVIATASLGPDGRYRVGAIEAVPTWMDQTNWRILPVTTALADPGLPEPQRHELVASYERTMATVTQGQAVAGLSADPLPGG
jgi:poly-gamma-glutamate synthesis protein (capsule biosynthesis protein)